MENQEEYVSLFNYLGTPAGKNEGYAVATAAHKAKEPIVTKMVTTKKYSGPVNMFRRTFLDEYYKKPQL